MGGWWLKGTLSSSKLVAHNGRARATVASRLFTVSASRGGGAEVFGQRRRTQRQFRHSVAHSLANWHLCQQHEA